MRPRLRGFGTIKVATPAQGGGAGFSRPARESLGGERHGLRGKRRVVSAEAPVRVSIGRNWFRVRQAVLPPWMPALPVCGRRCAKVICMQTHLQPAVLRRPWQNSAAQRLQPRETPGRFSLWRLRAGGRRVPSVGISVALERVRQARRLPRAANPRNLAAKAPAVPFLAKKTFFRGKVW